ncbi:hypothetical protein [Aliikangiella sp. IMCC44632]
MKRNYSLLLLPVLLLLTACSSHYRASSHHHHRHHSHLSVGVHGHSNAGKVLGALLIGGLIGHAISEAGHEHDEPEPVKSITQKVTTTTTTTSEDELTNGYTLPSRSQSIKLSPEQKKWYQQGDDGNCYLMQTDTNSRADAQVVSAVPKSMC